MDRDGSKRLLLGCLLLVLLGAQLVHYGASPEGSPAYPGADALERDYDRFLGDPIYAWTEVVRRSSAGLVVRTGDVRLTVVGSGTVARPGDTVQVYGRIAPDHRVTPERLVVSERSHLHYLYAISVLAAMLTAALGHVRWRFDRRRFTFVPREGDGDA